MNSIKYVIICFFFFTLVACNNQSKNNNSSSIHQELNDDLYNEVVEIEKAISIQDEVKDVFHLTKEDINELENESKIGNMIIYKIGKTMKIMSDGDLTYLLLGQDLSDYGIQNRFKHIFNIDHQEVNDEVFSSPRKISRFVFDQSFFKIYYNNEIEDFDIVSGRIKNEEIMMGLNIYIGIPKKKFFDRIFNDANQYEFSAVDTLSNGNEMGDIQQEFVFKNDTLEEVILKSDYDWISFDL